MKNPKNYCSQEIAQKLVDNGIILDTDFVYVNVFDGRKLVSKNQDFHEEDDYIPAPTPAEILDELPSQTYFKKVEDDFFIVWVCNEGIETESDFIMNDNLADALAELLIWVKGEKK